MLHRNTSITYTGPNSNGITKYFTFDSATVGGVATTYSEGRMAEASTCSGSGYCASKITDEGFSYDQRGQMVNYVQSSPNSGGFYEIGASYWQDKTLKTEVGAGFPTLTFGDLDGEGRVQTVSSAANNLVNGVTYINGPSPGSDAIGKIMQITLAPEDSQTFSYDYSTGRMTQYSATVGANPVTIAGTLTWNANGTLQFLNVSDGYNSSDTQNCSYAYDDFERVASVNCVNGSTKIWNQGFSYGSDAFGNLTKSSSGPGLTWAPGYNTANNRYSGTGSYDANGNLLSDAFHSYSWLADGHIASIVTGGTTSSVIYDAMGNKVEENVGGVVHEYVSALGISAQMTGQTQSSATVGLPGGLQALYAGGSLQRFRFPDWQGTIRAESNTSTRVFTESVAFAPFGERYALQGAPYNVDSFTGQPDQLASDEYDFAARELNYEPGRWISPDPTPGTGNKYAYADNNPLSKVDLGGLTAILIDGANYADGDDVGIGGLENYISPSALIESKPASSVQTDSSTEVSAPGGSADPQQSNNPDTANQSKQPPAQQQQNQAVGNTTEGSLAKVLTNEDGSLSTPKGGDPQQLVDGKTALANAIYNNANLAHPEKVAPATGTPSAQDSQIMQGVVMSRTNGGADPVQGRVYYGTSHTPDLTSRSAGNGLKGAAGRETVFAKFGPFKDSISSRPTYIYIYNNPGH